MINKSRNVLPIPNTPVYIEFAKHVVVSDIVNHRVHLSVPSCVLFTFLTIRKSIATINVRVTITPRYKFARGRQTQSFYRINKRYPGEVYHFTRHKMQFILFVRKYGFNFLFSVPYKIPFNSII